jgi:phage FluMu gp28-like protein
MDTGRKHDLTVIDVGEQVGDIVWDRLRLELSNKTFSEQEAELFRLLALPKLRRACLDATGLGMQLAERAREQCGWKVEPVTFTAPIKEELAWQLRTAFEDRLVRVPHDDRLLADLRGVKKEITTAGNTRFGGESTDSHCDRFWAKALRQQAARYRSDCVGAAVA